MDAMPANTALAARRADLCDIVRVHQAAFKGFFLELMGPAFLRSYYRAIFDYDDAILLIHRDGEGVIDGFAVGFLNPERFYRHFRAQRLRMLPAIAIALLRRPSLIVSVIRNTRRVSQPIKVDVVVSELCSIATTRRGSGIGSLLLRAFCERSLALGADEVTLTTDRDDNAAVVRFYRAHGFEHRGEETRNQRVLHVMTRALCDDVTEALVGRQVPGS